MFNFASRNLKIFFRQKSAVLFSLLGVLVIIGLYIVFLGDIWVKSYDVPDVENLMNHWIIAGIVSVTSITTTMGAFGILVHDREQKISKDFYASPLRRSQIVGGYIFCAYLVGVLMSILAFILGEVYIVCAGGDLLPPAAAAEMLGTTLLSVLMSSTLVFFIVSFFYSQNAFSTASSIIGTLIGFVTGIYLPIGTLPDAVQWVIKLFPVSHASALMRQIMMEVPMQDSFSGVSSQFLAGFKEMTGVTYTFGSQTATPAVHIGVMLATTAVFFSLALWNLSRRHGQEVL